MSNINSVNAYKRTIKGVITTIYCSQMQLSKKRGHICPHYTKEQLSEWLHNQPEFTELYDNWVNSGYLKHLKPSIDRLDDYKPYTISNIRLVTWGENNDRYSSDIKNGINTKCTRAVLQYDLDRRLINEYFSMAHAARVNNLLANGIRKCCIGEYKTSGGFIWRYKNAK